MNGVSKGQRIVLTVVGGLVGLAVFLFAADAVIGDGMIEAPRFLTAVFVGGLAGMALFWLIRDGGSALLGRQGQPKATTPDSPPPAPERAEPSPSRKPRRANGRSARSRNARKTGVVSRALPTGVVTFVFTDIEGSTLLLQHLGDEAFSDAVEIHHRLLREAIAAHGGVEVSTEGDAFFVAFEHAADAVRMAAGAQSAIGSYAWPERAAIRVRMGIHTGSGRLGADNYLGLAVHQAARIASSAHGGQVLVSAATRDVAGDVGDGVSWRPLGRHRLKDLGAAVELFQLGGDGLDTCFPPIRSLERVAHNLPIQASSFLGRAAELQVGGKLLAATRLLTVTGPGGTGKTRIAYQLAAEHLDDFAGGVWVVELAAVANPALVPTALMASLGLRDEPGRTATETIVAYLQDREALVVLDNCEHVIDAAAALAADLLRGGAAVRVLATSREPLRIAGETAWALEPLELPESDDGMDLSLLASADAVRLFCERAADAAVGFALSGDNAASIASICNRLEGMPLALELAAARVRSLPLAELARRLDASLDLLSKGERATDERHTSLRDTIAWSHELLGEAEQIAFRRLGVFAGGWTLGAAERVCAGDGIDERHVLDLLDGLVDKSLVVFADGRYRFLETIRAFALECLDESGERGAVAERHAVWFAELAHDHAEPDDIAGMDLLEADHPNVLAAAEHLAGAGDAAAHGQFLVDLSWFWYYRDHTQLASAEIQRWLDGSGLERAMEGQLRFRLGTFALEACDYPAARDSYDAALAIAQEIGDRTLQGRCVNGLAGVAESVGDYAGAKRHREATLEIAREIGFPRLEGAAARGLGALAHAGGDYTRRATATPRRSRSTARSVTASTRPRTCRLSAASRWCSAATTKRRNSTSRV